METWRMEEKKLVREIMASRVTDAEAADVLGVTRRTLNRYLGKKGGRF